MQSILIATLCGLLAVTTSALPVAKRSFSGPVVSHLFEACYVVLELTIP